MFRIYAMLALQPTAVLALLLTGLLAMSVTAVVRWRTVLQPLLKALVMLLLAKSHAHHRSVPL
jgi:hypothetical protein